MEKTFSVRQTAFLVRKSEALFNELRFCIISDKEEKVEIMMDGHPIWNGHIGTYRIRYGN